MNMFESRANTYLLIMESYNLKTLDPKDKLFLYESGAIILCDCIEENHVPTDQEQMLIKSIFNKMSECVVNVPDYYYKKKILNTYNKK